MNKTVIDRIERFTAQIGRAVQHNRNTDNGGNQYHAGRQQVGDKDDPERSLPVPKGGHQQALGSNPLDQQQGNTQISKGTRPADHR